LYLIIRKSEHAAVRVVNDHNFLSPKEFLTDDHGAKSFRRTSSGIANDLFPSAEENPGTRYMSIALLQAKSFCGVDARIHARDDNDFPCGRKSQITLGKGVCVFRVRLFKFVRNSHVESFGGQRRKSAGAG
jgi:hypothetical protein